MTSVPDVGSTCLQKCDTITADGTRLFGQATGQERFEMFAESVKINQNLGAGEFVLPAGVKVIERRK